jgi:hypothetical protein
MQTRCVATDTSLETSRENLRCISVLAVTPRRDSRQADDLSFSCPPFQLTPRHSLAIVARCERR